MTKYNGVHFFYYTNERYVGPATTVAVHCSVAPRVEVRTAGQAVAELGRRLSRLVLTQQQLEILSRDQPLLHIFGPPGTGDFIFLFCIFNCWKILVKLIIS